MDSCLANGCVKFTIKVVRWVPVAFIAFVLGWAYYVYVFHICFGFVDNAIQRAAYFALFNLLFVMMLWSYVQTIFAPLGVPPPEFKLTQEVKDDLRSAADEQAYRTILERFVRQNKIPVLNRAVGGGAPPNQSFCVRFCIKCSMVKPDRTHHCSICSQCILKFDHHCPWVNTCINFRNYKFFVLFLGYGFYLCVFGFFSILPSFIVLWRNNEFGRHGSATFHVLFLFFVAGMFGAALGGLFVYHLYLTAKNRSTIETFRPPVFHYGVDKNAYNLGIGRNFVEVFGKNRLLRLFPLFTSLGDGVVYSQLNGCMDSSISTGGGGGCHSQDHYNYQLTATSATEVESDDNAVVDCHHRGGGGPLDIERVLPPLAGRARNGSEPSVNGVGGAAHPPAVLWRSADRRPPADLDSGTTLHRADREVLFPVDNGVTVLGVDKN